MTGDAHEAISAVAARMIKVGCDRSQLAQALAQAGASLAARIRRDADAAAGRRAEAWTTGAGQRLVLR